MQTPQGAFYSTGTPSENAAPYILEVPAGSGITSNFYFLATDGDSVGNGITAVVTYSCPDSGTDSQMFMLSRKPYFVHPTTFETLAAKANAAVNNFDKHAFTLVKQMPGWCDYPFPENTEALQQQ